MTATLTKKTRNIAWTRVTTVASTLSDRYGLEAWAQRNTVLGIAARPDLYALAASCVPEDKDQLNTIVKDAQEAAKSRSGANLGTALHKILERIDSGEDLDVPAPWRGDVDAYCNALADNGITVHPEYMERIVVLPNAKVAGTLDRLVTIDGALTVADLKTGADVVTYGMNDIAIQLALYANAQFMWDGDGDPKRDQYGRYLLPWPDSDTTYIPMPPVDKTRALVIHLPVGEGVCNLHWVDIDAGKEAARLAFSVREWRKRKDLSTPYRKGAISLELPDDW